MARCCSVLSSVFQAWRVYVQHARADIRRATPIRPPPAASHSGASASAGECDAVLARRSACAAPVHICAGTGAHPSHICPGAGLTAATSAPGLVSPAGVDIGLGGLQFFDTTDVQHKNVQRFPAYAANVRLQYATLRHATLQHATFDMISCARSECAPARRGMLDRAHDGNATHNMARGTPRATWRLNGSLGRYCTVRQYTVQLRGVVLPRASGEVPAAPRAATGGVQDPAVLAAACGVRRAGSEGQGTVGHAAARETHSCVP